MSEESSGLKESIVADLRAGRWADALPRLEQWCSQHPDDARAWLNRGYCLVQLHRLEEALAAIDRCLLLDPASENATAWRRRVAAEIAKAAAARLPGSQEGTGASERSAQPEHHTVFAGATREAGAGGEDAPASYATLTPDPADRGWMVGSVVGGRYEVRSLARGGMGVVVLAFDRVLGRMVAVKTPRPDQLASEKGRARFHREAEAWIALGVHPNICCAYYLENIGGVPRLFIEYVDGGNLGEWLRCEPAPGIERRLDVASQIAAGLDYTHSFEWTDRDGVDHRGLVHRDIKPANILLTSDDTAQITDFGLVRVGEDGLGVSTQSEPGGSREGTGRAENTMSGSWQTVTGAGGLVGTPPYMAPELWREEARGTLATDVYAFGCLLYELFCGRRPFAVAADSSLRTRDAHLDAWRKRHLVDDPPDPVVLNPGIERRLALLMLSCVSKRPDDRPHSFAALRSRLLEVYNDVLGVPYPRPEPKRTQLVADSLNNRGVSILALGAEEHAIKAFREALAVDPLHLEATFNLGLLEWRHATIADDELDRRLSEAAHGQQDVARVRLLQAWTRLVLDDPEAARGAIGVADDDAGMKVEALALLAYGRAREDRSAIEEATSRLDQLVGENPSDPDLKTALADAQLELGRTEIAARLMTDLLGSTPVTPHEIATAVAALPGRCPRFTLTHQSPIVCMTLAGREHLAVRTASGEAIFWDLETAQPIRHVELGGPARPGPSLAAASKKMAAVFEAGPVAVFDLDDPRHPRRMSPHPGTATCVAISHDGSLVITGSSDRRLRLWNTQSGECESEFAGHEAYVAGIAWLDGASWFASCGADGAVIIWDIATGRHLRKLAGHSGPVSAVALTTAGTIAISGGSEGTLKVWDVNRGTERCTMVGHRGAIHSVAVIDELVVSGGADGTIRIWHLEGGRLSRVLRLANSVRDVRILPGERPIVLAAHGTEVTGFDLDRHGDVKLPFQLAQPIPSGELAQRERAFSDLAAEARQLIAAGLFSRAVPVLREARTIPGYQWNDLGLLLWSEVLAKLPKVSIGSVAEVRRLPLASKGLVACTLAEEAGAVVVATGAGGVLAVDRGDGAPLANPAQHDGVTDLDVIGNGEHVISAGLDGTVRFWRTRSMEHVRTLSGHAGPIRTVATAPDGRVAVSGGDDGAVIIWHLGDEHPPEVIGNLGDRVSAVAVSPDQRYVVAGGWDCGITVWNLETRLELARFEGHSAAVDDIAVSPDCRHVASASGDGAVRLWDLEGGRCLRSFAGHEGAVHGVVFAPDSRFLVTGGEDATIRFWDLRSARNIRRIEGHTKAVESLAIEPDGNTLWSAGHDGTLRAWFLEWEPDEAEVSGWDDRVRPFLDAAIRRYHATHRSGETSSVATDLVAYVTADLGRRGYGWLDRSRIAHEVELASDTRERRMEIEREKVGKLATQRRADRRKEPARRMFSILTKNLGTRLIVTAVVAVVVMLALFSLRSPESEEASFGVSLMQNMSLAVEERSFRLRRGMVLAYQGQPRLSTDACDGEQYEQYLRMAIDAELALDAPPDPAVAAEDGSFRDRYAESVACVGDFGDPRAVEPILRRAADGLHPFRLEDLLSVLVRIGGRAGDRVNRALADQSEIVRHLAALALVHSEDKDAVALVAGALEGSDPRAVEGASFVIIELITKRAIAETDAFSTVRRLCRSIDPRVRRNAVNALVLFDRTGPAGDLLDEALQDSDPRVVASAERTRDILRTSKLSELFGVDALQ